MTDRDRLIELLRNSGASFERALPEEIADYLIASGIIVPPCKVGDMVYKASFVHKTVIPLNVEGFIRNLASWKTHCTHLIPSWRGNQKEHIYISFSSFGKTVFLTQEQAEQALKECEG